MFLVEDNVNYIKEIPFEDKVLLQSLYKASAAHTNSYHTWSVFVALNCIMS